MHPDVAASAARRGARVVPVGFFSVHEALNCLAERLSVNPAQRHGAMELTEALGCEPLALAQAAAVIGNSTLACRDYRDYFARRRQQIGMETAGAPAAEVTWTLSLGQAESLLPGALVRLMLVLVALLDGRGIPGALFSAPSITAYLGGSVVPLSSAADPKPAWDALLTLERVGLININRAGAEPVIFVNSALQAAIRLSAPAQVSRLRHGRPRAHCWKRGLTMSRSHGWPTGCARTPPACTPQRRTRCGPTGAIRCYCEPGEALMVPGWPGRPSNTGGNSPPGATPSCGLGTRMPW